MSVHNAEATFLDGRSARRAVETMSREVPVVQISVDARTDHDVMARPGIHDQLGSATAGPGDVVARAVSAGTIIGAALGALLFLLPTPGGDPSTFTRVVVGIVAGTIAGATAGFLIGAGIARRERGRLETGIVIGAHTDDRTAIERAVAVLEREGASCVELVAPDGSLLRRRATDARRGPLADP